MYRDLNENRYSWSQIEAEHCIRYPCLITCHLCRRGDVDNFRSGDIRILILADIGMTELHFDDVKRSIIQQKADRMARKEELKGEVF